MQISTKYIPTDIYLEEECGSNCTEENVNKCIEMLKVYLMINDIMI